MGTGICLVRCEALPCVWCGRNSEIKYASFENGRFTDGPICEECFWEKTPESREKRLNWLNSEKWASF